MEGESPPDELAQRLEIPLLAEVLLRVGGVLALGALRRIVSFFGSMMRLNPVPTGSTKTRSLKASQDDSFSTSVGGMAGSEPSSGKPTRFGPTAPTWR
jgi:hypothetical protein